MSEFTAEQIEEAIHKALTAGDIEAVECLLRTMLHVDPRRAVALYDAMKLAVTVAPFIKAAL
jgi:hypothetical protein